MAILRALRHELADATASPSATLGAPRSVHTRAHRAAPLDRPEDDAANVSRIPLPSEIEVQLPAGGDMPSWMVEVALLPPSHDARAVLHAEMPPLLAPRRQRALAAHVASRALPIGELDLEQVVLRMAERRPLGTLPRRLVASLQMGVQLLCDTGPAMEPFALDMQALIRLAVAVAGRERVRVERFVGCPSRGLLRWDGGAVPYRHPLPGQPVLVISDLGSIRAPGAVGLPEEWLAFDAALHRRGNSLAVLFPGTASRVPVRLRSRIRVLALDRGTGVRQATSRAV